MDFQRLKDDIYVSTDICTSEAGRFLQITKELEETCNTITVAIAPELYISAEAAILLLKQGVGLDSILNCVNNWMSVWSGLSLIVNRTTLAHRDQGAAASAYDLLVVGGTHTKCTLDVPDLGARFSYLPGTIVAISGKVLQHKVDGWDGRDQICAAHFIKDAVHSRLNQIRPSWPQLQSYLNFTK